MAHSGSGLWRLEDGDDAPPPYWAYHWAGGLVLARHILERPEIVRSRRVLDLGAGSGVVGIAAAMAGAAEVTAADINRYAAAATKLNAEANGVSVRAICEDLVEGPPPQVDLVLVGDLFYAQELADRVMPFLEACVEAGSQVLIGDPGRAYLPRAQLRVVAQYRVPDFGEVRADASPLSSVFSLEPASRPASELVR
ncbi:MAG TPA: 50S ribosomal protein L11 methyltransferase [Devosiaceae bacterium]|nr:50S ribosomal protein L11 methyltransferase [Devosiaceae bacterium]